MTGNIKGFGCRDGGGRGIQSSRCGREPSEKLSGFIFFSRRATWTCFQFTWPYGSPAPSRFQQTREMISLFFFQVFPLFSLLSRDYCIYAYRVWVWKFCIKCHSFAPKQHFVLLVELFVHIHSYKINNLLRNALCAKAHR